MIINNKNLIKNSLIFLSLLFVLLFAFSAYAGHAEDPTILGEADAVENQKENIEPTLRAGLNLDRLEWLFRRTETTSPPPPPAAPTTPSTTCLVRTSGDGDVLINSSCTFSGDTNGAENGKIIVGGNATLTVGTLTNPDQTIIWNTGQEINITSGTIAIRSNSASKLQEAYLWMVDVDRDGYPGRSAQKYSLQNVSNDIILIVRDDPSSASYRRRNDMTNVSIIDCDDNNPSRNISCPSPRITPRPTGTGSIQPPVDNIPTITKIPPVDNIPTKEPPIKPHVDPPLDTPPPVIPTPPTPVDDQGGVVTTEDSGIVIDFACTGSHCDDPYVLGLTEDCVVSWNWVDTGRDPCLKYFEGGSCPIMKLVKSTDC